MIIGMLTYGFRATIIPPRRVQSVSGRIPKRVFVESITPKRLGNGGLRFPAEEW